MRKKIIGNLGENIALKYLKERSHKILGTNYYSRFGEIDIISENENNIIFTEVKTRTSDRFGSPEDALTPRKLQKIKKTALQFLNNSTGLNTFNWRIDLIAVKLSPGQKTALLKHFKNINGTNYS